MAKPTTIQTLVFSKPKFSQKTAKKWASEHDFSAGDVRETDDSVRIQQKDPGRFDPKSFRTIDLKDGVKAVIGHLKTAKADRLFGDAPAQSALMRRSQVDFDNGVVLDSEGIPTSIRVFKPGDNFDVRGLNAVYDPRDARAILSANSRADGSVPIDLAHGMVDPDAPTDRHEAYGFGTLRCDETGVWLDNIKWRDDFVPKLKERAWRFISPTFNVNRQEFTDSEGKEARITDLVTVSLTNIPATVDAEPIVRGQVAGTKKRIPTTMATQSKPAIDAKSEDILRAKREEEEEDEEEGSEDEGEDEGKGPMVRDDDEDEDSEEAKDGDDSDGDMDDVDLDSMDRAELKKFAAKCMDVIADMKNEMRKREESEEEDEEEEKRQIVNALHADRLINFDDKKGLLKLRMSDLLKKDRALRSQPTGARMLAVRSRRQPDRQYRSKISDAMSGRSGPQKGVTDDQVNEYLARTRFDLAGTLSRVNNRRDLDVTELNRQLAGTVWGTRVSANPQGNKPASR